MPTRFTTAATDFFCALIFITLLTACHKTAAEKTGPADNYIVLQPALAEGHNVSVYTYVPYFEGPETTYVGHLKDTMNFNGDSVLTINNRSFEDGAAAAALLRFDGLPGAGKEIDSAVLYLYGLDSTAFASKPDNYNFGNAIYPAGRKMDNVTLQQVTGAWGENTITWRTQPMATTEGSIAIAPPATSWAYNVSINITDMVKFWAENPSQNFGCRLGYLSPSHILTPYPSQLQQIQFYSSFTANATVRPRLVITFK